VAFQEYLHAVREASTRVERLEAEIHTWATECSHTPVIKALQTLRGVQELTAVTLAAEIGEFSRFRNPEQLMAYAGLVPREYSSGLSSRRGGITKTGNTHIRFVLGEAAWSYRYKPAVRDRLRVRQQGADPEVLNISLKAQERLHRKYWSLLGHGKQTTVAATAVARELLGFIWAIACYIEQKSQQVAA